jgi:pyruvate kinase
MKNKNKKINKLISRIDDIIDHIHLVEKEFKKELDRVHPNYRKSAINLVHYRAMRMQNLGMLQKGLRQLGVSRLAKTNAHVYTSLVKARGVLCKLIDKKNKVTNKSGLTYAHSEKIVKTNCKNLLGPRTKGRHPRIMVTFPSEAADDINLVKQMISAGMNTARINCAHDGPEVWKKMAQNVKIAAKELKNATNVSADLAGPKIRTGLLLPGPKIKKYRPVKNISGMIIHSLEVWLGPDPHPDPLIPHVPVAAEYLDKLIEGTFLYLKDTRHKKRTIFLVEKKEKGCLARIKKTTYLRTGLPLYYDNVYADLALVVGELPPIDIPVKLKVGDLLRVDKDEIPGKSAINAENDNPIEIAHIPCVASQVFDQVKVGEPVYFDDGKISGIIKTVKKDHFIVKIKNTNKQVTKLRAHKGINFPQSDLTIAGLTEKDIRDLSYVAEYVDVINMSFVNGKKDVRMLLKELKRISPDKELGIILKIETQKGFNNLIEIILEGMRTYPMGLMIARGDLAIEAGWKNIGRVQHEILSIGQAAHIPVVWATQVLETLAKTGIPSRAEITDAVNSQKADGVMLNKGPYIIRTISLLDRILKDMETFGEKNISYTPKLEMEEAVPIK